MACSFHDSSSRTLWQRCLCTCCTEPSLPCNTAASWLLAAIFLPGLIISRYRWGSLDDRRSRKQTWPTTINGGLTKQVYWVLNIDPSRGQLRSLIRSRLRSCGKKRQSIVRTCVPFTVNTGFVHLVSAEVTRNTTSIDHSIDAPGSCRPRNFYLVKSVRRNILVIYRPVSDVSL